MKRSLKIGSAFIGVIVGAGFASGQEVLQYFTSFGLMGIFGAIIATALFTYVGMVLVWLGSSSQTTSHKDVIYKISGKYLGIVIDAILIFTLFGVGVVMIAGAGSNLNQQFGMPHIVGASILTILIILIGMLKVDRVVSIIGSVTPILIFFVIIISLYSLLTIDGSLTVLDSIAKEQTSTLPNWFVSGINYVSFNTAVGASMAILMGSAETNRKTAAVGGLIGGLGLGILILLSNLAIFAKIEEVGNLEMPMLGIVNNISPFLGLLMSLVLFAMIFNTALSMFFSFTARIAESGSPKFKVLFIITMIAAYAASFLGFTDLVAYFYPLIGYLGLLLIVVLFVTPIRMKKKKVTLQHDNQETKKSKERVS
ncbi:YkvI family membrane protein [Oceanobacillus saliphilus]|uniref:YkvI family membrane protein n=1 Tax=Oceanobacillus saliphilus TaxID=2925834 RepID=UPI00201DD1C6|nr:hypothetical protein [Oceanobacillus saliphilus]